MNLLPDARGHVGRRAPRGDETDRGGDGGVCAGAMNASDLLLVFADGDVGRAEAAAAALAAWSALLEVSGFGHSCMGSGRTSRAC